MRTKGSTSETCVRYTHYETFKCCRWLGAGDTVNDFNSVMKNLSHICSHSSKNVVGIKHVDLINVFMGRKMV